MQLLWRKETDVQEERTLRWEDESGIGKRNPSIAESDSQLFLRGQQQVWGRNSHSYGTVNPGSGEDKRSQVLVRTKSKVEEDRAKVEEGNKIVRTEAGVEGDLGESLPENKASCW